MAPVLFTYYVSPYNPITRIVPLLTNGDREVNKQIRIFTICIMRYGIMDQHRYLKVFVVEQLTDTLQERTNPYLSMHICSRDGEPLVYATVEACVSRMSINGLSPLTRANLMLTSSIENVVEAANYRENREIMNIHLADQVCESIKEHL